MRTTDIQNRTTALVKLAAVALRRRCLTALAMMVVLTYLAAMPAAQAIDWVSGQVGDWSVGSNWDGGSVPTLSALARFGSGAGSGDAGGEEATINGIAAQADRFIIGQNTPNPTFTSKVILNSGSLTTDGSTDHRIGQTSEGWLTVNGGTLDLQNGGYTSDFGGRLIVNGGDINIGRTSTVGGSSAGFVEINGSSATFDLNGDYTFGAFGTAIFTADSSSANVTQVNNTGLLTLNAASKLTIDLSSYDFASHAGSNIVLFDYGTLSGTFGTVDIIGGGGTLDYAFDQGGGNDAIALLNVQIVPEPNCLLMILAGLAGLCVCRPRRQRWSGDRTA